MRDLERQLHQNSKKLGSHKFPRIPPNAKSRCPAPGSTDFQLTELQRAAQSFFRPGCDRALRRIMVELTPGTGKTCVYMEVISKFIGRINPDTGNYFNIIVLGDDEVFAAFESLRSCPAKVNLQELVRWNEAHGGANGRFETVFKRKVFAPSNFDENKTVIQLKDVNRSSQTASCALNTRLEDVKALSQRQAKATPAAAGAPGSAAGGSQLAEYQAARAAYSPANEKRAPPADFDEKKGEAACADDAVLWNGSKVLFLPYKFAARWILESNQGPLGDPSGLSESDRRKLQPYLSRFASERKTASKGKYTRPGLVGASSDTLFVIDEVQNLTSPSEWRHSLAKRGAPALSEALWRWSGDDPKTTPYVFAGTATPNVGTNPEMTVCLLQLLNGKTRKELFIPRWRGPNGTLLREEDCTMEAFRAILESPNKRETTQFEYPEPKDRRADRLIVCPKKFLDPSQGFVVDVTGANSEPTPFSLLTPKGPVTHGIAEFEWNSSKYTCQQAAKLVRLRKLLPRDAPDVSKEPAYRKEPQSPAFKTRPEFEEYLAYRALPCALTAEDAAFQYTRIYKPVYTDLNRQLLQQVVAGHVFTANSYFDYRLYPKILPLGDDAARPRTRLVDPFALLRCLPRLKSGDGSAPDTRQRADEAPRLLAERSFPSARVLQSGGGGVADQYPWFVPKQAAKHFLAALAQEPKRCKSCRWGERSLYADCDGLRKLAEELVASYRRHPDRVDLELENRLRDHVARNSPKLVAAADDMFASPQSDSFAPDLSAESKSFLFLNVENRKELDSNVFVIVASFYFRMRCRPYVQAKFQGQENRLPPAYQGGQKTLQHRIAWLDALLLEGGDYAWLREKAEAERRKGGGEATDWCEGSRSSSASETVFPPYNGTRSTDADPKVSGWSAFWKTWLKGYGLGRCAAAQEAEARAVRTQALGEGAKAFFAKQGRRETKVQRAKQRAQKAAAEGQLDQAGLEALEKAAPKPNLLQKERQKRGQQRLRKSQELRRSFYVPAIFAVGDSTDTMSAQESKRIHQKLYLSLMHKLMKDETVKDEAFAASRPKEWPDRFFFDEKRSPDSRPTSALPVDHELTFDEILHLIGSPGLREATVKVGMGCDPCVSDSLTRMSAPAGQSMIFAGKQAHKALDFKCTGLNIAFGPQPRGQRIQEMGRNWRTCVNLPSVSVRQLFLWGENELLHNDLLLDSFYQAQNEAIDWLRLITISASLGCSAWWDFSQWGDLLESYHHMRPKETAWFFDSQPRGSTPCLDARPSFAAASASSSASASSPSSSDSGPSKQPFFRCNRTNLFTPMFLNDVKQDAGRIVSSRAGAFRPNEIVSDDNSGDPTCSRGTAVELHMLKEASRKYCLSDREARALDAGLPRPPERRPLRLQDLRPPPRRAAPPSSPMPSPHTSRSRSLSAASRREAKAARRPASASPAEAAASQAAKVVAPPSPARGQRTSRSRSLSAASHRTEKDSKLPRTTSSPAGNKTDKPRPAKVAPPQAAATATGLADVGAPVVTPPKAAAAAPAVPAPVATSPQAAAGEEAARHQRREEVRRLLSEVQKLMQRVGRRL